MAASKLRSATLFFIRGEGIPYVICVHYIQEHLRIGRPHFYPPPMTSDLFDVNHSTYIQYAYEVVVYPVW